RRGVPLREAVLSAFKGAVLAARRIASAAEENPEEAVHEYRKSIRRARSLLALLKPSLGHTASRGIVEQLRTSFRETNVLRDRDVLFGVLSDIAGDDPAMFVDAAELTARLAQGKGGARPAKVVRRSVPIPKPLPPALEVTLPREFSTPDLERGLVRSYRRTKGSLERAVETRSDADFHDWRKRVKELRYQIELLASTGSRELKRRGKALG